MGNISFVKNLSKGIQKRLKILSANPYKEVNINWLKLKYYKHLTAGKIRTHKLFGKTIYFYSSLELLHAFNEIFIDGIYKQQLQKQPYIIDCGANIGLSVIYIKKNYPDAEVIAFEPDDINFDLLTKNIKSFGYTNVKLNKEAVWKENTILQFSNEGNMSSKIEVNDYNYKSTKSIKAVRLKDFFTREIDFLKIDIEGAEYNVLNDIKDKLQFVKNMFIEYHGTFNQNNELLEIMNIINKGGFNFYLKEAASVYVTPFYRGDTSSKDFDVQLNIFCFRI